MSSVALFTDGVFGPNTKTGWDLFCSCLLRTSQLPLKRWSTSATGSMMKALIFEVGDKKEECARDTRDAVRYLFSSAREPMQKR